MELTEQLWRLKQIYDTGERYYDNEKGAYLHRIPAKFPTEELAALKEVRRPPNDMRSLTHDETLAELSHFASTWTLPEAANAFLAGLWSAPFLWQSALTGKLIALVMPHHEHTPYGGSPDTCTVCGFRAEAVDATLLWYRRMTGGTPLDGEPVGHVFALRELERLGERPLPTEYDLWTFRAILTVLRTLPAKARYSKARDALCRERLLPSSRNWVYGSLLETLALIGVLDTSEYPGMATRFTTYQKRDERPTVRVEVQAPLAWWDADIGVNEETLERVFAGIDCSSVSLTDRPPALPPLEQTITGSLEKRRPTRQALPKSPDAGKGPAQAGDVYAVRVREDTWVTVYCHRAEEKHVVVEFLDGVFPEPPTKAQLKNTVRPRRNGRWQTRASGMDRTTGVKRVARGIPAPCSGLPEPDSASFSRAADLARLAGWCFDRL